MRLGRRAVDGLPRGRSADGGHRRSRSPRGPLRSLYLLRPLIPRDAPHPARCHCCRVALRPRGVDPRIPASAAPLITRSPQLECGMLLRALSVLYLLSCAAYAADAPPSIASRTTGLTRHDGFVPFYWDTAKGRLLLEVAHPGEDLLYGVGIAGGAGVIETFLDRGQLGNLGLVRFERVGPRVLLRQLQTAHRSGIQDSERARAVAESFPSAILAALDVAAEDPDR